MLTLTMALVCFAASAVAQDIAVKLNWASGFRSVETVDGVKQRVSFEGALHQEDGQFYPLYSKMLYTQGNVKAGIKNALYQTISADIVKELPNLYAEPHIEVINAKTAGRNVAIINLLPFRKNEATGNFERLLSCTIELLPDATTDNGKKSSRGANDYADHSVLAEGNWHKVAVNSTGVYKLSYSFVKSKFGVEPANLVFANFGVFGNYGGLLSEIAGQSPTADDLVETPIYIKDNNGNGKFDTDDYVLFYGQGPNVWNYPGDGKPFTHQKHLYSDNNFYFVTISNGTGKQAQVEANPGSANYQVTSFNDFAFHEKDEKNYLESGRLWLGDRLSATKSETEISLSFPNLVKASPVNIVSAATGRSKALTSFGAVILKVSYNGSQILQQSFAGVGSASYSNAASYSLSSATINAVSDNIALNFSYSSADNTAEAMIDYVEVNCMRSLSMVNSSLLFRNVSTIADGRISEFTIGNGNGTIVWDVTNPLAIKQQSVSYTGGSALFNAATAGLREFVAFKPDGSFAEPEYAGAVGNQDLHAIGQPDMVIVTHPDFAESAKKLADFHLQHQGIVAYVTTPQLIYNEFSSGKQDISAIRNFLKMLYDRAEGDTNLMPKYLLLFGDGSYDMVNRTSAGASNFVPTYQSYESLVETTTFVTDDYYGLLEDGKGGTTMRSFDLMDLAVGRLPVASAEEAEGVVEKIIAYKTPAALGNWRNTTTFIADDEDWNIHIDDADAIVEVTRNKYPVYNYNKIYLDAYQKVNTPAGARYPDVNTAILNAMNKGSLIMNYVGHGGINNWAHERVFNMNDIRQLKNINTLPLFVTATCEFSKFDKNGGQTAGEELINNKNGGAIALITTVRLVYSSQNAALNGALFNYIFEPYHGRVPAMGELLSAAKNSISKDANNRKFLLLGDPALKLNYPELNVVTTEVNGKAVDGNDTIKALQQVTIKGEVRNWDGTKATDFTGIVYPTVYDKISTLSTLKNSGTSSKRDFKLYRNTVFNGKATVTNGDFSFTFIAPKDIDYKVGQGRISYYADNRNDKDANGFDHTIQVGGSVDSVGYDDQGPKIKLFMNDLTFVDGGKTDANPDLLALLEDDYGINLGSSLGHEISAVLDENSARPIVLNDYYESDLNSYRSGKVTYPFYKLTDGEHTLTVKAWDNQNNSAEESISFIVFTPTELSVEKVLSYPNPMVNSTTFTYSHNWGDRPVDATVRIYTLNGDLVRELKGTANDNGNGGITWSGDNEIGAGVTQGIYIYRVILNDDDGNTAAKSDRIVVVK